MGFTLIFYTLDFEPLEPSETEGVYLKLLGGEFLTLSSIIDSISCLRSAQINWRPSADIPSFWLLLGLSKYSARSTRFPSESTVWDSILPPKTSCSLMSAMRLRRFFLVSCLTISLGAKSKILTLLKTSGGL
jgi:hypothetical protein